MPTVKGAPAAPFARQPQFGDPDYNFTAFARDLLGGGLRWPATVFAVLGAVLVSCIFANLLPSEMFWPIHVRSANATRIAIFALVFWSAIAVVNWIAHTRRRAA